MKPQIERRAAVMRTRNAAARFREIQRMRKGPAKAQALQRFYETQQQTRAALKRKKARTKEEPPPIT